MPLLEIAAFNIESAIIADKAGADRVELCSGLAAGGLTPTVEDMIQARETLNCPFFVMIRPKPGNFVYTTEELSRMKQDLVLAKAHGADGFVFGVMKADGTIDEAANLDLVKLADPLPCTFHRAFDDIDDKENAVETLIRCGFRRILTSGGVGNAADYGDSLHQLIDRASGRIVVMPGGGIRSNNIDFIKGKTGAGEYHSAAITDGGAFANALAVKEMKAILNRK
jgi:copper homeostasis protein